MDNTVDFTDYKRHKIRVEVDTNAQNPIEEWDGNAKYALWHNKYHVVNDTDLRTEDYGSWDELEQALIEQYEPLAILPVYMYDHSGQTIRTTPFGGMYGYFDSGQLGFVFVDAERLKEWGHDSREDYEKATGRSLEDDLRSNVALYDTYIRGEVYGYVIEDEDGDILDSCWGYYGDDGLEQLTAEAKGIIDYQLETA